MDDEVVLHVGVPKSGTTFLQEVLWTNPGRLRALGWSLAADSYVEHARATAALLEARTGRRVDGAWDRLADQVRATDGQVVISNERLVAADQAQVERAFDSLAPRRVTVVITARDLARQVASGWQQRVKQRFTGTLATMSAELVDTSTPLDSDFWRLHDVPAAADRWLRHVPQQRVVVVTVPPAGSPPAVLWTRFAAACGLDPTGFDLDVSTPNESLGTAQVELLRRVNAALGDRLPLGDGYKSLVRRFVANDLLAGQVAYARTQVDEPTHAWATARGEAWVAGLSERGVRVVGDLADLVPAPYVAPTTSPPDDAAVASAATELLADLLAQWQDRGRAAPRRDPEIARDGGARRRPTAAVDSATDGPA